MKSDSEKSEKPLPAKHLSLGHVIRQSEEIKDNVEDVASNLASINEILKQEKRIAPPVQAIEDALVKNKEAEYRVAKAADDLHQVNAELAKEVNERIGIESELADMKIDLAEAHEDLAKSRAKEEETQQIAFHDSLTGLPNRLLFEQHLDHRLIEAKRHGWGIAVLFIDIDKFKSINDSYGHDLGDKVLLMVANRLQSSVRAEDTVSRWGGDEFVCLLSEVRQEADMTRLAEKIVNRIAETFELGETVLSVRASIGIAIYPEDGEMADILFKNADKAMYKAKGTKKGVMLFRECSISQPE